MDPSLSLTRLNARGRSETPSQSGLQGGGGGEYQLAIGLKENCRWEGQFGQTQLNSRGQVTCCYT